MYVIFYRVACNVFTQFCWFVFCLLSNLFLASTAPFCICWFVRNFPSYESSELFENKGTSPTCFACRDRANCSSNETVRVARLPVLADLTRPGPGRFDWIMAHANLRLMWSSYAVKLSVISGNKRLWNAAFDSDGFRGALERKLQRRWGIFLKSSMPQLRAFILRANSAGDLWLQERRLG